MYWCWKRKLLIWLGLLVNLCEFITICMAAFNGNLALILFAICMHIRTHTHTHGCSEYVCVLLLLPFLQFFDCYVWQRQMSKCQTVKKESKSEHYEKESTANGVERERERGRWVAGRVGWYSTYFALGRIWHSLQKFRPHSEGCHTPRKICYRIFFFFYSRPKKQNYRTCVREEWSECVWVRQQQELKYFFPF